MARVTGPLFSLSASGSIGKTVTYGVWKGINWVREHFIPANPQSVNQTNVRTAWQLLVAAWQAETEAGKARWDSFAEGTGMSGFNQYMGRGMAEYIIQITASVTPVSVSDDKVGPPGETWTWTS